MRPIIELPTATIELDVPKVGKKPTKEQMDNLKRGAEAMAAHENGKILEALLTAQTPNDMIPITLVLDEDEKKESDRLRKIEQESASYMEEEE